MPSVGGVEAGGRGGGRWCWGREVTAAPVAPAGVGIYGAVKSAASRWWLGSAVGAGGAGWSAGGRGFWCDSGSGGDGVMVAAR